MAHIIIDRRKNAKGKSSVNRRKFVDRVKAQVRESVKKRIREGNVGDVVSDGGKRIKVSGKGLNEPNFSHDKGGVTDRVLPGNKEFTPGDRHPRPDGGIGGGGSDGSPDGEGTDEFEFDLTKEEFLKHFLEDFELPDLTKQSVAKIEEFVFRRAGFTPDGNPSRLNILRTMKQAKGRRLALRAGKKRKVKELERQLKVIDEDIVRRTANSEDVSIEKKKRVDIVDQLKIAKRKLKAVPFIDEVDLRYNRWEKVPIPTTQAVMFPIMDVSISMGEWEKEMAKRMFMLLLIVLTANYDRVDIVWIRHHTMAKETDEQEFFHSKESGGTIVSTAFELMKQIIDERYPPTQWNIYGCQASDGDNWTSDNPVVSEILTSKILPISQYFAYVEIDKNGGKDSGLWSYYEKIATQFDNFAMRVITDVSDIWPVFTGLFSKRERQTDAD
jgi:hypothetical protein